MENKKLIKKKKEEVNKKREMMKSEPQANNPVRFPVPHFRLRERERTRGIRQVRASAVDGGIDANVAGVEQVQNIVGNDNCERVRLSESESEKRLIN